MISLLECLPVMMKSRTEMELLTVMGTALTYPPQPRELCMVLLKVPLSFRCGFSDAVVADQLQALSLVWIGS
jgi:hypothetical protein